MSNTKAQRTKKGYETFLCKSICFSFIYFFAIF